MSVKDVKASSEHKVGEVPQSKDGIMFVEHLLILTFWYLKLRVNNTFYNNKK